MTADYATRIKAIARLHGVLWTEELVASLVALLAEAACEQCRVIESNARRNVADAWDAGMLAHTYALGTDDNPYRSGPSRDSLDSARDKAGVLTAEDIAALRAIEPIRLGVGQSCSETCAPHLHQHCTDECEAACGCSA